MERCNHQYRPSLRGGYMCELCEKDIDSETYDEIAQLTAERDRLKVEVDKVLPPFANGDTFWSDMSREDMYAGIEQLQLRVAYLEQPTLARHQPCGCVICTCEGETHCSGCGAHHCGTHPVGEIPNPIYEPHPLKDYADETYKKYVTAANKLHIAEKDRDRYKAALEEIAAKPTLDAAPLHSIAKKALPPNAVNEASGLKGLDALYTKEG